MDGTLNGDFKKGNLSTVTSWNYLQNSQKSLAMQTGYEQSDRTQRCFCTRRLVSVRDISKLSRTF